MKGVENYKKYDFSNNEGFQTFLKELDSPCPPNAMEFVKRHWYKQEIDQSFEPNFDGTLPNLPKDEQDEHTHEDGSKCDGHHHDHSNQQESKSSTPPKDLDWRSKLKRLAYDVENYLKMVHVITGFWVSGIAHYSSLAICILAIIRQLKKPQLSKEYFIKLSQNQFGQNLLYALAFIFYREQRNIFYFFPLMIHFWIGICEYFRLKKTSLFTKGDAVVASTLNNKIKLHLIKSYYEMALLPFLFFQIFFGRSTIFLLLFYYNFLKIKYLISNNTQLAFKSLNDSCKGVVNGPSVPKFVQYIYSKIEQLFCWTVKYESKKNNENQPAYDASQVTPAKEEEKVAEEKVEEKKKSE